MNKKSEVEDFLNLGVVLNDKKEVLLIRRVKEEKGRGRAVLSWAFPGGKQQPNETPKECVEREVMDETGYKVESIKEISSRAHPQFPVFIIYHLCRLVEPKPVRKPRELCEIAEIKWVKIKEIKKSFTSDLDPKVAKELVLG